MELYRHALSTLRSAHDLQTRIRALNGKSLGLVTLATRPSLTAHFLPPILVQFWREHPGVEVRVIDVFPRLVVLRDVLEEGVEGFAAVTAGDGVTVCCVGCCCVFCVAGACVAWALTASGGAYNPARPDSPSVSPLHVPFDALSFLFAIRLFVRRSCA